MDLLERLYAQQLTSAGYKERKFVVPTHSFVLQGVTLSGKSELIKHYLLQLPKATYLYIDCSDIRIEIEQFNATIETFCSTNRISTVVLDHYKDGFYLPSAEQLIIITDQQLRLNSLQHLHIMPLDFEEFLAHRNRVDESALSEFLQLGGIAALHKTPTHQRAIFLQRSLRVALTKHEFDLLHLISKLYSQKVSAHMLYLKLKTYTSTSKDSLYSSLKSLIANRYIHMVEKANHSKSVKKVYLSDITFIDALNPQKQFSRLFENMVYNELNKRSSLIYYDERVEFYLPHKHRAILCMPFGTTEQLFKKIESIEEFIVTNSITEVEVVTMSSEAELMHPATKVTMLPFTQWALMD